MEPLDSNYLNLDGSSQVSMQPSNLTGDAFEKNWQTGRTSQNQDILTSIVATCSMNVLIANNEKHQESFETINKTVYLHSVHTLIDGWANTVQHHSNQIVEITQRLSPDWKLRANTIQEQAAFYTGIFYLYSMGSMLNSDRVASANNITNKHSYAVTDRKTRIEFLNFSRMIQYFQKEINQFISEAESLKQTKKTGERKQRKIKQANQLKDLNLPLKSLISLLNLSLQVIGKQPLILCMLDYHFRSAYIKHPSREIALKEIIQTAKDWKRRVEVLKKEGLATFKGRIFEKLPHLLEQVVRKDGSLNLSCIQELEQLIIGSSIELNDLITKTKEYYSASQDGSMTHRDWCVAMNTTCIREKSQDEFIEMMFAQFVTFITIKTIWEDIFVWFEDSVVQQPDRFRINPSAPHFINLISEGQSLLDHRWQPVEKEIPESLLSFSLEQWTLEVDQIHAKFLNEFRTLTKEENYGFSLIPDLCELAKVESAFDGMKWLRMKLSLSKFKNALNQWARDWDRVNQKYEQKTVQVLKTLPPEERETLAEQLGQWMLEKKTNLKPVIDLLCFGDWIDAIAFDSLDPERKTEDYSQFFSPTVRKILNSFEPENLLKRSKPVNQATKLVQQTVDLPRPKVQTQSMDRSATPLPRTKPKIKTRKQTQIDQPLEKTDSPDITEELTVDVDWKAGIKTRKLLSDLYGLGFELTHQKGSHMKLVRDDRTVIVPNHPEQKRGTLGSIADQAGVNLE